MSISQNLPAAPPPHVLLLMATFDTDIRRRVLECLPHDEAHTPELEAKPVPELLEIYVNWLNRLVLTRPRRVHQSKALLANPLAADPDNRAGLDALIEKIRTGESVAPHLSRDIMYGYK